MIDERTSNTKQTRNKHEHDEKRELFVFDIYHKGSAIVQSLFRTTITNSLFLAGT